MNTIFKKHGGKYLKMYIINACTKTLETLWEKQEKGISYNAIIVSMKNPCEKKSRNKHYLTLTLPY
jgi:hypothetical protein